MTGLANIQGCICLRIRGVEPPCKKQLTPLDTVKMVCGGSILTPLIVCDCFTFREWYRLTINARNYFGSLLFANYYTAVYIVVTATNFTWYSSTCRNILPNGHRIPFPVCVPNTDPPVKISQIQPCKEIYLHTRWLVKVVRSSSICTAVYYICYCMPPS